MKNKTFKFGFSHVHQEGYTDTRKDIQIYNILHVHLLIASVRDVADNTSMDKQQFSNHNGTKQASIFGPQHDDLGNIIKVYRVSHIFQEYLKQYFYSAVSSNHDVFRSCTSIPTFLYSRFIIDSTDIHKFTR